MHSPTRVRSNIATFSARDSSDLHGEDGGVLEDEPELEWTSPVLSGVSGAGRTSTVLIWSESSDLTQVNAPNNGTWKFRETKNKTHTQFKDSRFPKYHVY